MKNDCTMHTIIEERTDSLGARVRVYPYRCSRCGGCFACEHRISPTLRWWTCKDGKHISTRPNAGAPAR